MTDPNTILIITSVLTLFSNLLLHTRINSKCNSQGVEFNIEPDPENNSRRDLQHSHASIPELNLSNLQVHNENIELENIELENMENVTEEMPRRPISKKAMTYPNSNDETLTTPITPEIENEIFDNTCTDKPPLRRTPRHTNLDCPSSRRGSVASSIIEYMEELTHDIVEQMTPRK